MSQSLINLSQDLKRLQDEGYDVEIRSNHLLIKNVPYVNARKEVKRGVLVSELTLAGDVTTTPSTHVAHLAGVYPCNRDGSEIEQIRHQSNEQQLGENLTIQHSFSAKPTSGSYKNYYEKMTTYVAILSGPARSIDPNVTAQIFPDHQADGEVSVFNYLDTATSRAGIYIVARKLEGGKVGIVGLGGTGSYVLDLLAKTPVGEIHLYDGDRLSNHNAFRSPGAPTIEELRQEPLKVVYFGDLYSKMHRHIVAHEGYVDASNVDQLQGLGFVFLCLDRGEAKRLIVEKLTAWQIPYIDVGMGVDVVNDALTGILRVTTSTADKHDHVTAKHRIPFSDGDGSNDYSRNIQIADLNSLNAALAVIKWKKLCGFYLDLEKEHFSTYTVDGNVLTNEDKQCPDKPSSPISS